MTTWLEIALLVSVGCGSPTPPPVCAAGAQVECACVTGGHGAQVCKADGSGFGECMGCGGADMTAGADGSADMTANVDSSTDMTASLDMTTADLSTLPHSPDLAPDFSVMPDLVSTPDLTFPASCFNAVMDGTETDVDCGGPTCPPCAPGKMCMNAFDCVSKQCAGLKCAAPSCNDGIKNGMETDMDCGGPTCPVCHKGAKCLIDRDCNLSCLNGICQ